MGINYDQSDEKIVQILMRTEENNMIFILYGLGKIVKIKKMRRFFAQLNLKSSALPN